MTEVLHFGVNLKDDGSDGYEKELRDSDGIGNSAYTIDVTFNDTVSITDEKGELYDVDGVLDVATLVSAIQTKYENPESNSAVVAWNSAPTSANLALQMLEGVERVRFITTTDSGS